MITALLQIWNRLGWQLKLVVALIALGLILGVSGLIYHSCATKTIQDELRREKEARSQEHQEMIEEKKEEANVSGNIANQAKANTQKIENANFSNTNLTNANAWRCRAFPERCR